MATPDAPSGHRRREPLFHQLPGFTEAWDRLKLSDQDLLRLERELMVNPEVGRVVPDAGGLRKLRFAPPGRGKSGGLRVFYANLPEVGVVLLGAVLDKTERADLTPAERRASAAAVAIMARWYAARESTRSESGNAGRRHRSHGP